MMEVGGLVRLLAAMGVLGAVFYALESSLAPLLARWFPGYGALEPRRRLQVRVRSFESLASIYLCLGGIGGAVAYALSDLNYVSGYSAFAYGHALALAAFYLFHLWRMAAAGGYPRALYPHHFFMALGLVCCLAFGVLPVLHVAVGGTGRRRRGAQRPLGGARVERRDRGAVTVGRGHRHAAHGAARAPRRLRAPLRGRPARRARAGPGVGAGDRPGRGVDADGRLVRGRSLPRGGASRGRGRHERGPGRATADAIRFDADGVVAAAERFREAVHVVRERGGARMGVAWGSLPAGVDRIATLPPLYPEWLGDRSFCEAHGVRFPYVAGAMANGIATTRLVIAMARAGMLGFFGAAGLAPRARRAARRRDRARARRTARAGASNLIHSPQRARARGARSPTCYLARGVRASSALGVHGADAARSCATPASGLRVDAGRARRARATACSRRSRGPRSRAVHVAGARRRCSTRWSRAGCSRADEARAGARACPVAEDITVEADSRRPHRQPAAGGAAARRSSRCATSVAPRTATRGRSAIGAAGGLGTPARRRRGVRARRRLRAHRLGQPGCRRVGPLRRRQGDARRGRASPT